MLIMSYPRRVTAVEGDVTGPGTEMSRICVDLDVEVAAFWDRSLSDVAFHYLFLIDSIPTFAHPHRFGSVGNHFLVLSRRGPALWRRREYPPIHEPTTISAANACSKPVYCCG
jgi:hypothetical protein